MLNWKDFFSKLKRVKINFCCSLGVKRFENILRIMEEGSSWETFDPMSAIKKWSIDKIRCATEEIGSHSYNWHTSLEGNVKSLSDDGSSVRKKIFLKMVMNKDICFLLIPSKIIIFFGS